MDNGLLKVRIVSPNEEYFSGEAVSVSSQNLVGPFDILSQHGKFITLVENQKLVVALANGEKKEWQFPVAILHVHENLVDIYVNPTEAGKELL